MEPSMQGAVVVDSSLAIFCCLASGAPHHNSFQLPVQSSSMHHTHRRR